MMEKNKSGLCSWLAIITMLILFWPIGIYFLFKRISGDKGITMSAKAIYIKYIGIFLCVGAVIMLAALFGGTYESGELRETIVYTLFLGAGGVALLMYGKKVSSEANDIRKYISIIANGYVGKIDEIAGIAGKPYEIVKKDLQGMIDKGYLKNAYIDEATQRIVLTNDPIVNFEDDENHVKNIEVQTHIVICPNCGASNVVASGNAKCEYCCSPLQ